MKVTIEIEVPAGRSVSEAEAAVKRHFDQNWMAEWWHTDDVIEQAENHDAQLTEEEAREVLRLMDKYHDCNYGHTWDSMDHCIDLVLQEREEENA